MSAPDLLVVDHLAKSYGGVHAVRDLSFAIAVGEVLAVIGPNGAGKSTCFNIVNGQIVPDAGTVTFRGRSVGGLGARAMWRLGVGRTFQVAATFGSMTVAENVQVALQSGDPRARFRLGFAGWQARGRADELLDAVGLGGAGGRPCAALAYGDLKRLELAVALASDPVLLLMDEPTAGMAPGERTATMRFATGLARARGIAILFTEHDTEAVFGHADRVLVMNRGRLLAAGTPDEIRRDPRVRETYLGDAVGAFGAG